MPILHKRKTKTGETYSMTLPKEMIMLMGWRDRDTIIVSKLDDKSLKLEKV